MITRKFLSLILACGLSLTLCPRTLRAQSRAGTPRKPNVLIFLADDYSLADVGCYGNKIVRTPNIDGLARDGLRFDRAFTPEAICSPSRSTLYTGLYPHRHGCHMNHGRVRPGTRSLPHYLAPLGYRVALAGKTHVKPQTAFPFEYMKQNEVGKFLAGVGAQPFCLVIASNEPHSPHKSGGYAPAQMMLPPYLVDTPETRRAMADYYTDIDILDRQVGEALALLKQSGQEENTLVIFASDNGAGVSFFNKWTLYDAGLHLPFIARWPGRIRPGTTTNAMISFVDVLPTLVQLAGGTPPADLDGRSFLPVLTGARQEHRDVVFGTHTNRGVISGSVYPIRAVRTATHKYIRNLNADGVFQNTLTHGADNDPRHASKVWQSWLAVAATDRVAAKRVRMFQRRPTEELYDLRTDPYELNNLAADPRQEALLGDLRNQLDAWMRQQGDRGLEAELAVTPHQRVADEKDQ